MEKGGKSQTLASQNRPADLVCELEAGPCFQQRALNWVLVFLYGARSAIIDQYAGKTAGEANQELLLHLHLHSSEKLKDNM